VVEGLDMGKGRLVSWDMRGVLSALSFTDSNGVCYFDQAWLRRATDIVGGKRGDIK
jgi:hypothetical protein